jgi:hypothetical protein
MALSLCTRVARTQCEGEGWMLDQGAPGASLVWRMVGLDPVFLM